MNDQAIFVTVLSSPRQRPPARLMIESLRAFGGPLSQSPLWIFEGGGHSDSGTAFRDLDVEILPLSIPDSVRQNWFAAKVWACARAEELVGSNVRSLVWVSSDCLFIQPPLLYALGLSCDAALRPVHIRNIGQPASESPDEFWGRVYQAVGVGDIQATVVSFVDEQRLRAYYNSHIFAVDPSKGLMRQWYQVFEQLVEDRDFQSGACQDELHQIFLHQAVLSALVATRLDPERVCMLPPDYNYPYNLQDKVPPHQRTAVLNELVSITCEDRSLDPDEVEDIRIDEPLRSWLSERHIKKIR